MQTQHTAGLEGFQAASSPEEYLGPSTEDLDAESGPELFSDELACPQRGGFKASMAVAAAAKLQVSLATPPAPAASNGDDFFANLLVESLALQRDKGVLKESRAKLKDTRVQGTERAKLEATVREIELVQEWSAVSNVVIFTSQVCQHCGKEHSTFAGLFQRQVSKSSKINRWQPIKELVVGLPKERKYTKTAVPICCECVEGQNWGQETEATYTPSPSRLNIVAAAEKSESSEAISASKKSETALAKFLA